MPIAINYKICDKGKGCPCIAACPAKAWFWDEKNKRPAVDNSKCNDCWICIKTCPARAALFAFSEEELGELKKEIERDPRSEKDLMSERYNADPISQEIVLNQDNFDKVVKSKKLVLVEFWAPKFLSRCRINAPAYKDILPANTGVLIRKINAEQNPNVARKYGVISLPSMVLFHDGKPIDKFGKIFGCSSVAETNLLKEKIEKALKAV